MELLIYADMTIGLCLLALFISILINFAESTDKNVKKEKKSIVETGSMVVFFLFFYALIRFKIGALDINGMIQIVLVIFGLLMIIVGCTINIMGRLNLGKNWANQVKIYDTQTLVKTGMYGIVRHPLYASIMLMFYGACLVHPNYLAFLANTLIFIPFMYYRARQEEVLLSATFKDYSLYQKEVGMFFPNLKNIRNRENREKNKQQK
jgi:protein-S-isoprenylcysteine O-methyltransferase Ste14